MCATGDKRRPAPRRAARLAGLVPLLLAAGCAWPPAASLLGREAHPWGPRANDARARGRPAPEGRPAGRGEWAALGKDVLRDGDLVFRRGRHYGPGECLASGLVASVTDSPFSHEGVVCREGGEAWVYDVNGEGVRKVPFDVWARNVAGQVLAVKRVRPEYRDRVAPALAFCEDAYRREVPYDYAFAPGDEAYYCAEMVEKAYRSAGLPLSDPVPIRSLPNFRRHRLLGALIEGLTAIRLDAPVFVPGNDHYGTYASPYLEAVYATDEALRSLGAGKPPAAP